MISSETNQNVRDIIKLQKQHKYRQATSRFVAEGLKLVLEAADSGFLEKVYISGTMLLKLEDKDKERLFKYPYEVVTNKVFQKMSDTITAQGVLGIARIPSYDIDQLLNGTGNMWLLLDCIQDPGNLGTIIRTAEGAGMSAVIMGKGTASLFNPKTVRSTMGAIFRMPFVYTGSLVDVIKKIRNKGYNVYGAAMEGSVIYDRADYSKGAGIVIGNEANGISQEILEYVTSCIRIPMEGRLESLNAAVSAAVIMYEAARQKRNSKTQSCTINVNDIKCLEGELL